MTRLCHEYTVFESHSHTGNYFAVLGDDPSQLMATVYTTHWFDQPLELLARRPLRPRSAARAARGRARLYTVSEPRSARNVAGDMCVTP